MNHLSASSVLAKDVMNPESVPLNPGKFEKDLALQFLSGHYSGWPVVDSARQILGIVTEFRLLQAVAHVNSLDDLEVEDTMTTPVWVFEHDPLDVVLKVMVQNQVMRIPVVDERVLVGVISRGHVLRHCLPLSSSSPRAVPSCVWCERVQDLSDGSTNGKGWEAVASFLARQGLTFSDIDLALTCCPSCLPTLQALRGTSWSLSSEQSGDKAARPCLLVVDDDPSVRGMLDEALREWGYDVVVARNGREGLDVVGRHSVDGILLDMHMPVMDGRTMLDELRWLKHQVPVLMMSGGSDEQTLRQLLQEGAQGFFLKPFHLASLKQACRQVFKQDQVEEYASSHFHVA
jgi:CheY-like chemotaxis protein/CBS domain-containing protein